MLKQMVYNISYPCVVHVVGEMLRSNYTLHVNFHGLESIYKKGNVVNYKNGSDNLYFRKSFTLDQGSPNFSKRGPH
jgi:hypothetical protein